jgi:AcrR family transcriptional regulator
MSRTEMPERRRLAARGKREDGATTRAQLMEHAGMLFAERGFDRATARMIAERAGSNAAAINYHFGGIDNLYAEVLVEAHDRLVNFQSLVAVLSGDDEPRDKLRKLIEMIVLSWTGAASSSWAVRVIAREILSPSPHNDVLRQRALEPKKSLVLGLVAELVGLPREHPVVTRACFSVAAPCAMLMVADRQLIIRLFPELEANAGDTQALTDHLVKFALGGLAALAPSAL